MRYPHPPNIASDFQLAIPADDATTLVIESGGAKISFGQSDDAQLTVSGNYKGRKPASIAYSIMNNVLHLNFDLPAAFASRDHTSELKPSINADDIRAMAGTVEDVTTEADGTVTIGGFFRIGPGANVNTTGNSLRIGRQKDAELNVQIKLPKGVFHKITKDNEDCGSAFSQ